MPEDGGVIMSNTSRTCEQRAGGSEGVNGATPERTFQAEGTANAETDPEAREGVQGERE